MEKEKEFLSPEEASIYGSVAMRAAYLGQDRPDLQVATRSLAQGLQLPTVGHQLMLKRLARYLRYRPRMAQFFPHQTYINPFVMWTDSDHAGCIKTRKSASGGVLMAGGCCVKTYSKGQEDSYAQDLSRSFLCLSHLAEPQKPLGARPFKIFPVPKPTY